MKYALIRLRVVDGVTRREVAELYEVEEYNRAFEQMLKRTESGNGELYILQTFFADEATDESYILSEEVFEAMRRNNVA